MKDIKFKIDSGLIDELKHLCEIRAIKFTRDLLIRTDKDKNIVVVLLDLSPYEQDHQAVYPLMIENKYHQKSKTHFMFYTHEANIKMREMKYKYGIHPIAIPPCTDYDVRIFEVEKQKGNKQYFMEMISAYDTIDRETLKVMPKMMFPKMMFTFPLTKVTKDTHQNQ